MSGLCGLVWVVKSGRSSLCCLVGWSSPFGLVGWSSWLV